MSNTTDRPRKAASWDETFMGVASLMKERSKDPSTQVGACIVDADRRLLSVGYNGAPNGFSDDLFPWGKEDENPLETKYPYVVHAERNAILNFRGSLRDFAGATVYVTHFPCNECAKELIQVGIKHVIYLNGKTSRGMEEATIRMFDVTGITYSQYAPEQ